MVYDPFNKNWKDVYCPVCKEKIGVKTKEEIATLVCVECDTEHTYYPAQIKRPGKSVPRSLMKDTKCGCNRCGR